MTIAFEASGEPAGKSLSIFDVSGRLIRSYRIGDEPWGRRVVSWDLRDTEGRRVKSGVYFCLVRAADGTLTSGKIVVTR